MTFKERDVQFFFTSDKRQVRLSGAQGEGVSGVSRAGAGVVVCRELVRIGAVDVPRSAADSLTGGVVNGDVEAGIDQRRTGVQVDAGHVPEEEIADLGVLVLQNVGAVRGAADLDGDAASVGVDLPGFLVGFAGREGEHGSRGGRDGPDVEVLVEVVDDRHAAIETAGGREDGQSRG